MVCALIVVVALVGCSREEQIQLADGSNTQMSHWQDRWLVINYWAEWCGPCRHEIPELNELHRERVANGMVVLGVNYDGIQPPKLNEVIERMQIDFPVLLVDPQLRFGYNRAEQLPMTVIIAPDRQVHDVLIGPQTAASIMAALN
jgi:thiol-disulfide isomerase/thioredoxin